MSLYWLRVAWREGKAKGLARQLRLRGTRRITPAALVTKAVYSFRNRKGFPCWKIDHGYNCEWVYPYGWVPEAGCPLHD